MSITAPPRPDRSNEPLDRGEVEPLVEALIEEARQRARRRRARNTSLVLALLVGFALYVGFARGGDEAGFTARSAVPSASGAPSAGTRSLSFRLLSISTSTRFRGTTLYVRHELRNGSQGQFGRPRNAVVGSDAWVLTPLPPVERRVGADVFVVTPGSARVRAHVRLPGGTLRLQGRAPAATYTERTGRGNWSVRVVGGTGRYAKARGTCWVRWRPAIADWNDYRLRLS